MNMDVAADCDIDRRGTNRFAIFVDHATLGDHADGEFVTERNILSQNDNLNHLARTYADALARR